jgi:hypothetical protein
MFMVNSSKEGAGFWARHKGLTDGVFKAVGLFVGLKLLSIASDKLKL